jgi:HK97 family phage major capsid protein
MEKSELIEKRMRLLNEADEMLKRCKDEGRYDLTGDENKRWEEIHADADKIKAFVDKLELQEGHSESQGRRSDPNQHEDRGRQQHQSRIVKPTQADLDMSLRAWTLPGNKRTDEMRAAAQRTGMSLDSNSMTIRLAPEGIKASGVNPDGTRCVTSHDIAEWERRTAQGTTSGAVGLYTVPDETMRALEVSLTSFGGMRQVATVIRTATGADLPIPTVDDASNSGEIITENTTINEQGVTFGQTVLQSFLYSSKYVLVSLQLLQDSAINVGELMGRLLGERLGRITNTHFTTGDGSSKPRGIVAAAGSGVTSVADPPTYDNFVDLVHSVDPAYRTGARFMMNDATLKTVKKIKVLQYSGDTVGTPLWQPSMVAGQPDTILGYQYVINQQMASPGSSAKKVIFGDLSKYMIRDVRDIEIQVLRERFAEYHQVAFLAFLRADGDLLDAGTDPVKYMAQS